MPSWLKRVSAIGVILATAVALGNFEALAVALLLVTFLRFEDRKLNRRLKIGVFLLWICTFVIVGRVMAVAGGPRDLERRILILRLYDLNCSAPFAARRRPLEVTWLAKGDLYYGSWGAVLVCRR